MNLFITVVLWIVVWALLQLAILLMAMILFPGMVALHPHITGFLMGFSGSLFANKIVLHRFI